MSTFKKWSSDSKWQFWLVFGMVSKVYKTYKSHNSQLKNWVKWVSQYYRKNGLMLYEMRVLTFDVASQVFILSRSELRSQATLNFLQVCGVSREVVISRMFQGWDFEFFIFTQSLRFSLMTQKKKTTKLDLANRSVILNKSFTNDVIAL